MLNACSGDWWQERVANIIFNTLLAHHVRQLQLDTFSAIMIIMHFLSLPRNLLIRGVMDLLMI